MQYWIFEKKITSIEFCYMYIFFMQAIYRENRREEANDPFNIDERECDLHYNNDERVRK